MTLAKVVGPDGTARTASFIKVVGPDGVLRTASFVKVVGSDGVLRTVYAAGGTPPVGANPSYIDPPSKYLTGYGISRSFAFTAKATTGSPTAYAWGLLSGEGYIVSGGTSATATLNTNSYAEFYCDVTVAGMVYRATCSFDFTNVSSSGGQPSQ